MDLQLLAAQLKKPEGEMGKQIGEVMNKGNKLIHHQTIAALDLQKGDKVLEIGMGNGYFIKDILAAQPSVRYEGLDYSEVMLSEAKKINQTFIENEQVHFTPGTADAIPFADHTFSKIFTINTIYFWGNAKKELAEVKRLLQPGGKFIIAIRSKESMHHMPFTEYGFVKYDKDNLIALLEDNSFKIIHAAQLDEPPQDFNGKQIQLDNIIVSCTSVN